MALLTQVRTAGMALLSSNASTWTPSVTTWALNTAISSGDFVMWVVAFAIDGTVDPTETSGNGWSMVYTKEATSQVTGGVALLLTTGAFAASTFPAITLDFGAASEQASARISAYKAAAGKTVGYIRSSGAQGSSTNTDPPSVTNNTGAAKDTIFIAMRAGDGTTVPSAASSGYGSSNTAGGTQGASTTTETKQIVGWANAAVEDPGVWTVATEQWVSYTVALFETNPSLAPDNGVSATTTSSPAVTAGSVSLSPDAAVSASIADQPTVSFHYSLSPNALNTGSLSGINSSTGSELNLNADLNVSTGWTLPGTTSISGGKLHGGLGGGIAQYAENPWTGGTLGPNDILELVIDVATLGDTQPYFSFYLGGVSFFFSDFGTTDARYLSSGVNTYRLKPTVSGQSGVMIIIVQQNGSGTSEYQINSFSVKRYPADVAITASNPPATQITPANMVSASLAGVPTITPNTVIAGNPLVSASTTSQPTVTAHAVVAPAALTSATLTSQPTVAWKTSIAPANLTSASLAGVPSLVAHAVISPAAAVSASLTSQPTVGVLAAVQPANLTSASLLGVPTAVAHAFITPASLTSATLINVAPIVAHAAITPQALTSASQLSIPSIVSHVFLQPANMASGTALSVPSFLTYLVWNDAYSRFVNQTWPEEAYFPEVFNATDIT